MKILLIFCLALIGSMISAQSVIVKATGAGAVLATGAGSVRGVATPAPTSSNYCDGRFTIFNTNQDVVLDNDSGLMWTRDANIDGQMDWYAATNYCATLDHAGHDDWRLPSIGELTSLIDTGYSNPALTIGHPFVNVQSAEYWSSTRSAGGTGLPYEMNMATGQGNYRSETHPYYVWPVRGP